MDEDDKAQLLALMYQDDADEDADTPSGPKPERPNGIMNMPSMSHSIRRMQETMDRMQETILAQDRMLKRMNQRIRKLETNSSVLTKALNNRGDS